MPNKLNTALKASSSLFKLVAGLYIVRVATPIANPVTLAQAPSEGGSVDFFPAESVTRNTLVKPGDCIVLRVRGESATLVATEFYSGSPTVIRLQVERIDVAAPKAGSISPIDAPRSLAEGEVMINLVGHIQNRGDVVVKNDWLGKPGTVNRLEGFAIRAEGLPPTVKLVYGVKFFSQAFKPQMSKEGKFVGTRKKAQGIQSVIFTLEGADAEQYALGGDVAFSGSIGCNIVPGVELKGPQGEEHLVGINLKIQKKSATDPAEDESDGLWTEADIRELFSQ